MLEGTEGTLLLDSGTGVDRRIDRALLLVSTDSHVSPPTVAYRDHCPATLLEQFDAFVANLDGTRLQLGDVSNAADDARPALFERFTREYGGEDLNADPVTRVASMDTDGIAAEVIFHGGFNAQPIPFFTGDLASTFSQDVPSDPADATLRAEGIRMYNRWLARFVGAAPDRLIGLAHIPMWDVQATVDEIRAAHSLGLRGVNLPAPRRTLPGYNQPAWDPVWTLCSEFGMSLHTHGGGGDLETVSGPGAIGIHLMEVCFYGRRGLWQMILGGVFERYPELVLFLTEQSGGWVTDTLRTMDSAVLAPIQQIVGADTKLPLTRRPSDYFRSNCVVGCSFMARMEAEAAIDDGYWQNVTWGRDFPHPEGTWPFTLRSIAHTTVDLPPGPIAAMLGGNAVQFLGLDEPRLRVIADRIGPTLRDLSELPTERPEGADLSFGFRTVGSFA